MILKLENSICEILSLLRELNVDIIAISGYMYRTLQPSLHNNRSYYDFTLDSGLDDYKLIVNTNFISSDIAWSGTQIMNISNFKLTLFSIFKYSGSPNKFDKTVHTKFSQITFASEAIK
jgi:hypothetical protein